MKTLVLLAVLALLATMSPWARAAGVDVRVDGEGYLRFIRDGRVVYLKEASLEVRDGLLVNRDGVPLIPSVSVTSPAFKIDLEGNVTVGSHVCGRLVLALFQPGSSLRADGTYLLAADRPKLASPGEGAAGVTRTSGEAIARSTAEPKPTPSNQPTRGVRIVVRQESSIEEPTVRLGSIAEIAADPALAAKLQEVDLGPTPRPNIPMTLDRERVMVKLRAAGLRPENYVIVVPERARVLRKAKQVEPAAFVAAAEAHLRAQGVAGELTAAPSLQPYAWSGETVELLPEGISSRGSEHSVQIAVVVDGKRTASRVVKLAGQPPAEGVKAGEALKIIIRSKGAAVEVTGKAKARAALGERVEVSTDRGTKHVGKVVQPGVVEVTL